MQSEKDLILSILSTMPEEVLKVALIYAQNYTLYGVDVTKAWETALEQSAAMNQAYKRGFNEGLDTAESAISGTSGLTRTKRI